MFKIDNFDGVIVCASKYFNPSEMLEIKKLGINDFGENRVQDLLAKQKELVESNIIWHFIGKLQTNKIKSMINTIDYLHSLESIAQAELIEKYRDKPLFVFIQVNISDEEQKSGINPNNLAQFINELKKYDKIVLIGLMTIGVLDNLEKTEKVFNELSKLKDKYNLKYLSMGMTGDYELAIKHGSTHLRLGTYFKNLVGGNDGII
ncbi:YggS family pyridoxal phosphate-dependent enzyme [Haploplasma axanthum]|uniref:Predicted enzyme with a TIM-barrel fold n=1 Tax=Haploplasma axanthum TaxID=29552 RepID=A0A449BEG5_HAPAX|nr:YggS family pyridoxal phosphate-dependent enzyme [Haploplasma axanthum]VEU80827.1 Predicted enzyme with a TIM-barrel fold [Haploplasma axanthum]